MSHIWSVQLIMYDLGHSSGFPEAFWVINLPLYLFFWYMNVRFKKFASWRSDSVAVVEQLQLKVMSPIQKGVISDLDPVYSPGWRSNK